MKRLKIISIITLVFVLLSATNVAFAYDDYCPETEDGWHDYTFSKSMTTRHPHKGYRACFCGERVYLEYQYNDECETCRKQLCKKGIHYYLADVHYLDKYGYTGYGECYCGRTEYFYFDDYRLEKEPYEGFITFFDELYSVKHPHYEYNMDRDRYYYDNTIHAGSCGVCELEDQYYDDVQEYELNTFIYNDVYFDEEEEDYWNRENLDNKGDNYTSYYDQWYDFEDEYNLGEDDEFYEWLELVKEILNE